jgi:hypothetical protein
MASKEVMVSAPLMVWLWDRVFGSGVPGRRPLYAGLAATWLILIALVWHETRAHSVGLAGGWTSWSYLLTQAGVIVHYLRLAIVPVPLVFDYHWPAARSLLDVAPQAALLVVLFGVTMAGLVRRRPAAFLGVWCFAILAPTSSVLPIATEVASEHRMYLPLAAIVAFVVLTAVRIVPQRRVTAAVGAALVTGIALTFGALTYARNRDYASSERLWSDTVRKQPQNPRARENYGIDLLEARRYQDAEAELRVAVDLNPVYAEAHMALGLALCSQGKTDDGERHLARALALGNYPDDYRERAAATLHAVCLLRSINK